MSGQRSSTPMLWGVSFLLQKQRDLTEKLYLRSRVLNVQHTFVQVRCRNDPIRRLCFQGQKIFVSSREVVDPLPLPSIVEEDGALGVSLTSACTVDVAPRKSQCRDQHGLQARNH